MPTGGLDQPLRPGERVDGVGGGPRDVLVDVPEELRRRVAAGETRIVRRAVVVERIGLQIRCIICDLIVNCKI